MKVHIPDVNEKNETKLFKPLKVFCKNNLGKRKFTEFMGK